MPAVHGLGKPRATRGFGPRAVRSRQGLDAEFWLCDRSKSCLDVVRFPVFDRSSQEPLSPEKELTSVDLESTWMIHESIGRRLEDAGDDAPGGVGRQAIWTLGRIQACGRNVAGP